MIRLLVVFSLVSGIVLTAWNSFGVPARDNSSSNSPSSSSSPSRGKSAQAEVDSQQVTLRPQHAATRNATRSAAVPDPGYNRATSGSTKPVSELPGGTPAAVPPISLQQQEAIQEILGFRALEGDVLEGTSFAETASDSAQQFADVLQDVVRKSQARQTDPVPSASKGPVLPHRLCDTRLAPSLPQLPGTGTGPRADAQLTTSLRDVAELLDDQANTRERLARYAEADRLRRLARRLRLEARRWSGPDPTNAGESAVKSR